MLVTDHDRAVSVSVGQKIEVYLMQPPHMTPWTGLSVDDPTVLQRVNILDAPARGGATVVGFVAAKTGVANVTAYTTPACAPNQACPMYAMLFQVRVTVD